MLLFAIGEDPGSPRLRGVRERKRRGWLRQTLRITPVHPAPPVRHGGGGQRAYRAALRFFGSGAGPNGSLQTASAVRAISIFTQSRNAAIALVSFLSAPRTR